ncbi:hypothetical protein Q5424_08350 [Conexibacter sp. JD483]|uniref:hypothetical protein n=1 Tax=unclassified Conexibacter TaxID=2627773 RepID=UPI002718C8BD|nr:MULTISPECIES: hypothetical protein [unclassified Conexibacter]MDO8183951.1 hypothetical protein [Conexibacter sp. CPCC 205706]MDO8196943.1 hypothetical protein [Conexibacter sp. CPCC 205762]MDR9369087.1 hypothetical protein [Conexibacter sp. JD483]
MGIDEEEGAESYERPDLAARWRNYPLWGEAFAAEVDAPLVARLGLLTELGFGDRELALVVPDATPQTIARWRAGTQEPPPSRDDDRLDRLWAVVRRLLFDAGYDEQGIVAWICSPRLELADRRPIDLLAHDRPQALEEIWTALDQHLE